MANSCTLILLLNHPMRALSPKILTALLPVLLNLSASPAVAANTPAVTASSGVRTEWEARLDDLMRLVTAGDETRLLQLLRATTVDAGLPPAIREQVLHEFTVELRELPPGSVGHPVMEFLSGHEPQVMVPHEDHPDSHVPLFNLRAASAGVQHTWRRREASYAGFVLLAQDPALLVRAYLLHDDSPVRQGLLESVAAATPAQLETISFLALNGLEQEPALTELAGTAALRNEDTRALEQVLRTGSGSGLTRLVRDTGARLDPDRLARLLASTLEQAPPETAALAIAEWSSALAAHPDTENRLLSLLGDPQLGSAAALALANHAADSTTARLLAVLESGQSPLAASRARLALELLQLRVTGEVTGE